MSGALNHVVYPHPDIDRSLSYPKAITSVIGLEDMYLDLAPQNSGDEI